MSAAGKLYLNGEIVPAEQARIPVDDRAVLFGDCLFETLRAYNGKPFRLRRHLDRLRSGCALLRMHLPRRRRRIPAYRRERSSRQGRQLREDNRDRRTLGWA